MPTPTQPETANYDTSIYQLQATDNCQGATSSNGGGVLNTPLLSLANRTGWLKAQVASIITELTGFAAINSQAFTGTPTVPEPPSGDSSQLIANTEWVQAAIAAASQGSTGWQKLPSGLIIQWGSFRTNTGKNDYFAFPIAFPTSVLSIVVSEGSANGWGNTGQYCTVYGTSRATGSFALNGCFTSCVGVSNNGNAFAPGSNFNLIAIGY